MSRRWWQSAPGEPFTINRNSPQAVGLMVWYPTVQHTGLASLVDYASGLDAVRTGTTNLALPQGPIGRALSFDGSGNDYFTVADHAELNFTGNCTFSFWWYTGDLQQNTEYGLLGKGGTFPNDSVQWYFSKPAFTFVVDFRMGDGTTTFYAAETETIVDANLSPFSLYHIVGRREGIVLNTFTNGWKNRLQTWDFASGAIHVAAADLTIGKMASTFTLGTLADVRIYNRALSDAECIALYQPQTRWDLYAPLRRWYYMPGESQKQQLMLLGVG